MLERVQSLVLTGVSVATGVLWMSEVLQGVSGDRLRRRH